MAYNTHNLSEADIKRIREYFSKLRTGQARGAVLGGMTRFFGCGDVQRSKNRCAFAHDEFMRHSITDEQKLRELYPNLMTLIGIK